MLTKKNDHNPISPRTLCATVAVIALTVLSVPAHAETTVTTTTTTPAVKVVTPQVHTHTAVDTPIVEAIGTTSTVSTTNSTVVSDTAIVDGKHAVRIVDFDLDHNHILTRAEVGHKLFKIYDTDGNEVIDNLEYGHRSVITVAPVTTESVVQYDFNGDGVVDQTKVTTRNFMDSTMLSRFDAHHDGLSPHEFTGRGFLVADLNNDKKVDLKEWEASYNAELDAHLKAEGNVNQ